MPTDTDSYEARRRELRETYPLATLVRVATRTDDGELYSSVLESIRSPETHEAIGESYVAAVADHTILRLPDELQGAPLDRHGRRVEGPRVHVKSKQFLNTFEPTIVEAVKPDRIEGFYE